MQFSYSLLNLLAFASVSPYAINNNLIRRANGAIAAECNFSSKLTQATTEQAFSVVMNDCNIAYSNLLAKDPSQQNAIALQNEIEMIKREFSNYKNNYFLTHPSGGETNPTNPIPSRQTIMQRCNIEAKISTVQKRADFDPILESCSQAYTELINADQSRVNELNSEWLQVQNRIKVAQEDFARTHPEAGNGNGNGGNNGEKSSDISKMARVDERLASAHSYMDFDLLINDCNIAFVTLNTDSSKTVKLQNELEFLKAKIVAAKANFRP